MKSAARAGRIVVAPALILTITLLATPAGAGAPWEIDWWTIDSGGEIFTSGGRWSLSGTVGQWDAVPAGASGGSWEVTAGFWAVSVDGSDRMFSDGFE